MASERVKRLPIAGERRVIGGVAVEITRHGKGFRVYGCVLRRGKDRDTVQLKRLPAPQERMVLAAYGSPYAGA